MYQEPNDWLWKFGTWVNGGHWSTCEARMVLAYYRLGKTEDARRSMKQLLTFARDFRMDNPLVEFGSKVYQPKEPINLCYDSFGPPAAMIRGLFEYLYRADRLTLCPHIPAGITELEQNFPIRFGAKRIYLKTAGSGEITSVRVNGEKWKNHDRESICLPYDQTPETAWIEIFSGTAPAETTYTPWSRETDLPQVSAGNLPEALAPLSNRIQKVSEHYCELVKSGSAETCEAAHARVVLEAVNAYQERLRLLSEGTIPALPEGSQSAANQSYQDTVRRLLEGFEKLPGSQLKMQ
jgi:hypothetical protein